MPSEDSVSYREFARVVESLERQLDEIKATGKETLAQAKLTNGRVTALEVAAADHSARISSLNGEVFRGGRRPVGMVTKRDVSLVLGTVGVLWAIVKAFPVLLVAGQAAAR